jgi:hypothetical protein
LFPDGASHETLDFLVVGELSLLVFRSSSACFNTLGDPIDFLGEVPPLPDYLDLSYLSPP